MQLRKKTIINHYSKFTVGSLFVEISKPTKAFFYLHCHLSIMFNVKCDNMLLICIRFTIFEYLHLFKIFFCHSLYLKLLFFIFIIIIFIFHCIVYIYHIFIH